jgi:hypothetical protein
MECTIFRPDEVRKIVAVEMRLVRSEFSERQGIFSVYLNDRNCKLPRIVAILRLVGHVSHDERFRNLLTPVRTVWEF